MWYENSQGFCQNIKYTEFKFKYIAGKETTSRLSSHKWAMKIKNNTENISH